MRKKDIVADFNQTPYYKMFLDRVSNYQKEIILEIMKNNDNDPKYTWNDVLKLVFKILEVQIKEFADSLDVNPAQSLTFDKDLEKAVEEQTKLLLNNDML